MNCGIKALTLINAGTFPASSFQLLTSAGFAGADALPQNARLLGVWVYCLAGTSGQVILAYSTDGITLLPVFSIDIPASATDVARGKWFGVSGQGVESTQLSAGAINAVAGVAGYNKVAGGFPMGMPLRIESNGSSLPLNLYAAVTSFFAGVVFYYTVDPPTQYGENGG